MQNHNSKSKNSDRGFIKVALIIVAALVLLKYIYDIDILEKVYSAWIWIWGKYGSHALTTWEWLKSKFTSGE